MSDETLTKTLPDPEPILDGPMIPPSTPIGETVIALLLTAKLPSHVRTAGDLLVAAERGEVKVSKAQREKIG